MWATLLGEMGEIFPMRIARFPHAHAEFTPIFPHGLPHAQGGSVITLVQCGPARMRVRSTTRTPASGPYVGSIVIDE